jgi:hypothetical protein
MGHGPKHQHDDGSLTVIDAKTGKRQGLKTIQMESNVRLSRGSEEFARKQSDKDLATIERIQSKEPSGRFARVWRSGTKAEQIKRKRRKK